MHSFFTKLFFILTFYRQSFFFLKSGSILLALLLLQTNSTWAQWVQKQSAIKKRGELTSIVYKNKIYNFTGFGVWPEAESTSEVYDPATNKWALLAAMPAGKTVTHQGVAQVDDNVWHIGGRLKNTTGALTHEVWIYNLTDNTWKPGPPLLDPATRNPVLWAAGGAALVGRTIHVFGGFITDACNNDQDQYHFSINADQWLADPENTTWENKLAPMPVKRNHISTTVLGGKIYALGGQFGHDCKGGQDQKYSHVYNPLTDTWTQLTNLPTVRSHCEAAAFPVDGTIYLAGGDGAQIKVTALNPLANGGLGSWADVPALQLPKNYIGVSAKVVGNQFIISGGKWSSSDTRRETYVAPIKRSIPYRFGFLANCITENLRIGESKNVSNLLYTIEGEKQYTLTSNATWLKLTKNANGLAMQSAVEVEAIVDATHLSPGNYQATVTATGTGTGPAFTSASFCVSLKVTDPANPALKVNTVGSGTVSTSPAKPTYNANETVLLEAMPANGFRFTGWSGSENGTINPLSLIMNEDKDITANFTQIKSVTSAIRINAGGTFQTVNGISWDGCAVASTCTNFVTGGFAYTEKSLPVIAGASYHNLNQSIYQTEWTGGTTSGALAFKYVVPVTNGEYLVRLYFTELNKNGVNLRKFDVKLENTQVLTNFDIFAEASGWRKAIVREFPVTVSDGTINIDFIRRVQNAKISAIEIIPMQEAIVNAAPVANPGPDEVYKAGLNGYATIPLDGTNSIDPDGYLVSYLWEMNNTLLGTNAKTTIDLPVGTHRVTLTVKDNAGAIGTISRNIQVDPAESSTIPANSARKITYDSGFDRNNSMATKLLKIQPNPIKSGSKGYLTFQGLKQSEEVMFIVHDLLGRNILTYSATSNSEGKVKIELPGDTSLKPGMYMVSAYSSESKNQEKVMVEP